MNVVHTFVPHARRRDEKVEAILDAAMKLLAKGGIEALTLQSVARELGLVTTALYRYFDSKDALLAGMQRRAVGALHDRFRLASEHWAESAARLTAQPRLLVPIVGAARFYVSLPETMPEPFRLVSLLLSDPRTLVGDAEVGKTVPLVASFLADAGVLFDAAARGGALDEGNAPTRTLVFWASLHGLTQIAKLRRVAPQAPSMHALADEATRALLVGWGARPDSVRRAEKTKTDSRGDLRP